MRLLWLLGLLSVAWATEHTVVGCEVTVTQSVASGNNIVAVINAGRVVPMSTASSGNATMILPAAGFQRNIVFYEVTGEDEERSVRRVGETTVEAMPLSDREACEAEIWRSVSLESETSAAGPRAGILYEGWHTFAATAYGNIQSRGGPALSVEDVLTSNGTYTMFDILDKWNARQAADGFFYQAKPAYGYYCIYRHRPGEPGIVPDCPNITETTERHAQQLLAAGISYVLTDSTNLGNPTPEAEAIQVRPTEVLFEEWTRIRQSGGQTPQIAVWQVAATGTTLWQTVLNSFYNNATYIPLIATDQATGKKLFFIPYGITPDMTIWNAIESNGGRNDIMVVGMWALFDQTLYSQGRWGFFSPCTDENGGYTTSVSGAGITPCNQNITTNSPIGSAIAVSPSYQMSYGSLPFCAPSKFRGNTFKRQFATALANPTANLFLSSWNEWISQPQPNPFNSPYAFSMGLYGDSQASELWVDTYGASISRDIEPSAVYGAELYNIMASCMRVLRLAGTFGLSQCSVQGEECCTQEPYEAYHNVWSLMLKTGEDHLLTTSSNELNVLVSGGAWEQVCNAYGGPTDFCVDSSLVQSPMAMRGPFVMNTNPFSGSIALYRCLMSNGGHFFSPDPGCEGTHTESLLGYLSPQKTSNTPRALRRCRQAGTVIHYHTLDYPCAAGDAFEGLYGFVH